MLSANMADTYWNKRYKSKWRYQIQPSSPIGFLVFVVYVTLFLAGTFSVTGQLSMIPTSYGWLMAIFGTALFAYGIVFKTDYSDEN